MSSALTWANRSTFRPDSRDPYLHLHLIIIHVRDQQRSLRFYLEKLGFTLYIDEPLPSGARWVQVAPPDGAASLALIAAEPGSEDEKLIGRFTSIIFLTEDVERKYQEWSRRGVHFQTPPVTPDWGGTFARFEDIDGNSFGLAGFNEATRAVQVKRGALQDQLESERRAAQELEIAKQVQARLFPQNAPLCQSLDYSGICIQARQVGGDYYDFLDLGQGRLGLIIGDISGKGIAAALLMANLQANIRSQSAVAGNEPERLLESANRLFYDNTSDNAYATLFFAEFDSNTQTLTYINCGHLPALLLRQNAVIEPLESTATVLGLFKEWNCSSRRCRLFAGDTLAIYTDGVTEAASIEGDEFGEERLIEAIRRHRGQPSEKILASLVAEVRQFSAGKQHDDITAIVAKCNRESIGA